MLTPKISQKPVEPAEMEIGGWLGKYRPGWQEGKKAGKLRGSTGRHTVGKQAYRGEG